MGKLKKYDQYQSIVKKIVKKENLSMYDVFLLTLVDGESLADDDLLVEVKNCLKEKSAEWNKSFAEDFELFQKHMCSCLEENKAEINKGIGGLSKEDLQNNILEEVKLYLDNKIDAIEITKKLSSDNLSDDHFQMADELLSKKQGDNLVLKNTLLRFRYFWTDHFNKEAIIMFLHADLDIKPFVENECSFLRKVIKKQQHLFQNMYKKLRRISCHVNSILDLDVHLPDAIEKKVVYTPVPYKKYIHPTLVYFRLKKLLISYDMIHKIKESYIPEDLSIYIRIMTRTVLEESRLMKPYYPREENLVKFITEELMVNQKALASLFGVEESTLSGYKNKIPRDRSWIIKSMTEFSLTFLSGKTTIPCYGKHKIAEDAYMETYPVIIRVYGMHILNILRGFLDYENFIRQSNDVKRLNHKADFFDPVTKKAVEFVETMRKTCSEYEEKCASVDKDEEDMCNLEKEIETLRKQSRKMENPEDWKKENELDKNVRKLNELKERIEKNKNLIDNYRKSILNNLDALIMALKVKYNEK